MKRIGIFGGTFNPIHHGHLINAQLVREEFKLEEIFFVPSKFPVHKFMSSKISPDDRFNMLVNALKDMDYFHASREELDRDSPSYTILTLKYFQKKFPHGELYFILGKDAFNGLEAWHCSHEIGKFCKIIVLNRNTDSHDNENEVDQEGIILFNNPRIEISSTMIRERIAQGKTIRYMTPRSVIEYIEERELYRS